MADEPSREQIERTKHYCETFIDAEMETMFSAQYVGQLCNMAMKSLDARREAIEECIAALLAMKTPSYQGGGTAIEAKNHALDLAAGKLENMLAQPPAQTEGE